MRTKLVRSLYNIRADQLGGVLTIGNFDGVHLGHQCLIKQVVDEAKKHKVSSTVITFEPHPFEYFAKEYLTIPRITRLREKFTALRKLGVDYVLIIPFEQQVASMSASDFVNLLAEKLKPIQIIVGDDFHFGKARTGNLELLQTMGATLGFSASAMPTFEIGQERVSSTRIRQALAAGDQKLAEQLLGRPYTMLGRVRSGDQLGRQLGFPTANIFLHRRLTAVKGIYIVRMHGLTDKPLPGVANVGIRPTVDGTRTLLEVHLLDFDQDIYHRYVEVEFIQKIRDEERYESLDILKEKIAEDVAIGREFFERQERA